MKVRSSVKSLRNRKGCILVSRRRAGVKRLFVVNKKNPKFNARQ